MPQLELWSLVFLAAVVALWWGLPRLRTGTLLVASLAWLGWLDPWSLALTLACAAWVYRGPHGWAGASVPVMLFGLFRIAQMEGQAALPVGFAFMTLRLIHYAVERPSLQPHRFVDCVNYLLFFPTLAVGPIHLFPNFYRAIRRIQWDPVVFAAGLDRILYGYVKVVVLAGWVVGEQMGRWLAPTAPAPELWLACLRHGLNIYFVFAGCSDIAIGGAALLGLRIEENFNHPYLQPTLRRFWGAWHTTLTEWCRSYVYLPIAARTRSPMLAALAAVSTLGAWHELHPRYALWALWHLVGLWVTRSWHPSTCLAQAAGTLFTFTWVTAGWVFLRNRDVGDMAKDLITLGTGW